MSLRETSDQLIFANTPPTDVAGFEPAISEAPPHLYEFSAEYAGGVSGLARVGDPDLAHFRKHGFLLIRDALGAAEIASALAATGALCAGKVPGFDDFRYEAGARGALDSQEPEARQDVIRKLNDFVRLEPRMRALAEHDGLLSVLRSLLDDEPLLFQDMALLKPPRIGREKPWHQDCAYFDLPPGTRVVGAWIALDAALVENGCMHIVPGSHREGPVVHFQRRDWQICDTEVQTQRCLAVPMQPGDCLLFDGLMHHGTPPSRSDLRRRALQFHYRPASVSPLDDSSERLRQFGEEGKDVSC